ncbi:hypothetical protein BX070DRAFT_235725 [Coemansia spiralis]|nr:hypothetical protein BX070DRAFT_235725 [Coemansia spiralis]
MDNTRSEKRAHLDGIAPPAANIPTSHDLPPAVDHYQEPPGDSAPAYSDNYARNFHAPAPFSAPANNTASPYSNNGSQPAYTPPGTYGNPPNSYNPPPPNPYNGPYNGPPSHQYSGPSNYQPPYNSQPHSNPQYSNSQFSNNSQYNNNSQGFTMAIPERLFTLARRPQMVDRGMWTEFMRKLNEILAKAPGTVTNGIADFWVIQLATLGIAPIARNMYQNKVQGKATELAEQYNRAEFSQWGIRVHLDVLPINNGNNHEEGSSAHGQQGLMLGSHERRAQKRADRNTAPEVTLELVISKS